FRSGLSKKMEKSPAEGVAQPGAGVGPFLAGLIDGDAQGGRDGLVAQPGEVAQLDHLGRQPVLGGEAGQGVVEGEEPVGLGGVQGAGDITFHGARGYAVAPWPASGWGWVGRLRTRRESRRS